MDDSKGVVVVWVATAATDSDSKSTVRSMGGPVVWGVREVGAVGAKGGELSVALLGVELVGFLE